MFFQVDIFDARRGIHDGDSFGQGARAGARISELQTNRPDGWDVETFHLVYVHDEGSRHS